MRLAAIDIGTNSVHMIIVRVRPDLSFEVVDREKEMGRLGAGSVLRQTPIPASLKPIYAISPACVTVMNAGLPLGLRRWMQLLSMLPFSNASFLALR